MKALVVRVTKDREKMKASGQDANYRPVSKLWWEKIWRKQ